MRAAKVIGLGTLFSFTGFIIVIVISAMRGTASPEPSRATALSAVVGGLIEALFSPITLFIIVIAFATAIWVTRKTPEPASTS